MTLGDIFNSETVIEHGGKSWRMRQPTGDEEGEFQRWLEKRAFDAIERRTYQDESKREHALNMLVQDQAAGVYEYNGEVATRAVRTPLGLGTMVGIILRDQGGTIEIGREMVKTQLKQLAFLLVSKANTLEKKEVELALAVLGLPRDYLATSANSSSPSPTHHSTTESTTSEPSATTSSPSCSTSSEGPAGSPS